MAERLMSTAELAEWLGISEGTVHNYRTALGLPFLRLSASVIRFRPSEVEAWLTERNRGTVLQLEVTQ
jgi:excisionase family DNA binding protein